MTSCIFTVIKNEHEYLDEWIKYHLNLGINHIFIFEDINSLSHKEITDKYSSNNVTLNNVSILNINKSNYRNNWDNHRQAIYYIRGLSWIKTNYTYNWCFPIDNDEYITLSNNDDTLVSILNKYSDYDAVVLYWQNYNANKLIYKPEYSKQGIIETYTQKCERSYKDPSWKNTKIMYNMKTYKNYYYIDSHLCYDFCNWCKSDFSKELNNITYDNIYLRHYITKSWEEYVIKLKVRGMFNKNHRNYKDFFDLNPDMVDKQEELIKIVDDIINKNKEKN